MGEQQKMDKITLYCASNHIIALIVAILRMFDILYFLLTPERTTQHLHHNGGFLKWRRMIRFMSSQIS